MKRLLGFAAVAAAALAVSGAGPAAGATSCGQSGWGAASSEEGTIYEVQGDVRARNVSCARAERIVRGYVNRTEAEGGPLNVKGFRCRGGPRPDDRYIVNCRREGGKRVFLDGEGSPA